MTCVNGKFLSTYLLNRKIQININIFSTYTLCMCIYNKTYQLFNICSIRKQFHVDTRIDTRVQVRIVV